MAEIFRLNKTPYTQPEHRFTVSDIEFKAFNGNYFEGELPDYKIDFTIYKENDSKFSLKIYDSNFKDKSLAIRHQQVCFSFIDCVDTIRAFVGMPPCEKKIRPSS